MDTSNILTDITPGSNRAKRFIVRANFFILGRGLQAASRFDSCIKKEISRWNEGFTVVMKVRPEVLSLAWRKSSGRIRYMGSGSVEADLAVIMKNLDTAFLMVTAQMGTFQAYAQNRIALEGNTVDAMILTRCLNTVEAYLFPKFVSRRILKRLPKMTPRRFCIRFLIYFPGIIFGV